ncbi:hypothetical protein H257_12375 [Aphanomyces astaci]|uniref:Uncharacterized protein n=1 Tax=Aphanomyces astaci TaxID=112090 RepID=W4FYS5_APHAT|nr:hypothetical protein H257_12375 [Aphanomyces astaci]ETV72625.1 hypothetical protein H257_12375 [Aphanomyces astaci]|eukprot:XP_009837853.1 hypothetical protein H257_12375 [Aphanomyces astaci]
MKSTTPDTTNQVFLVPSVVVFTVAGVVVIFAASSAVVVSAGVVVSRVVLTLRWPAPSLETLETPKPEINQSLCSLRAYSRLETCSDPAKSTNPTARRGRSRAPSGGGACDRLLARWTFKLPVARLTVNDFTVNHV